MIWRTIDDRNVFRICNLCVRVNILKPISVIILIKTFVSLFTDYIRTIFVCLFSYFNGLLELTMLCVGFYWFDMVEMRTHFRWLCDIAIVSSRWQRRCCPLHKLTINDRWSQLWRAFYSLSWCECTLGPCLWLNICVRTYVWLCVCVCVRVNIQWSCSFDTNWNAYACTQIAICWEPKQLENKRRKRKKNNTP